ncbi:uncharacterized protein LOC123395279 isoform X2 [Hordeum vulgare subsp. vulgare]|uniref:uncharacterized protein LOC123395279 isoform X2 n=1 Tax=Hordeum vulgare subsp. vulgare TaxID=112509 RepID=UPI001D1A435D|nr:uncharacterized protein LOC123395279 isoform X2 [Hordeum vulgare subsp. vulgare]
MSGNQTQSSDYERLASQPDAQCLVCTRPFTLDTEVTNSFEALAICRECKATVLNDSERDVTTSTSQQRRQRRRRSRTASLESNEDAFSQQFSQLINLARQGHEADIDSPTVVQQLASYNSTPNQSQRWHASDDESDGLSYADSVFDELESNISFGDYGGESDASLGQHSMMGREITIQLDNESYMNTDTDIDPMNAGIDQWDSDDQEDEQLEESDFDEAVDAMQQRQQQSRGIGPSELTGWESEDGVWTWRSQRANMTNLMADMEVPDVRTPFVGNPGDYADARQFEMILEQFAEDDSSRRGAPPAATSFIGNLPSLVISTSHEADGGLICPVCKDPMPIRTRAKQLPCMHLYHSSCILPWLSSRNTCPVCRYELPTDDPESERPERAAANERDVHGVEERTHLQEIGEEGSDEPEAEETQDMSYDAVEVTNTSEHGVHVAEQSNRARAHRRWLFIAVAPASEDSRCLQTPVHLMLEI